MHSHTMDKSQINYIDQDKYHDKCLCLNINALSCKSWIRRSHGELLVELSRPTLYQGNADTEKMWSIRYSKTCMAGHSSFEEVSGIFLIKKGRIQSQESIKVETRTKGGQPHTGNEQTSSHWNRPRKKTIKNIINKQCQADM